MKPTDCNSVAPPGSLERVVGTPGEVICCDVCGEVIGKNLTGYAWRTHRAICGLCLDDLLNEIGKYFPRIERPNDKLSEPRN